MIYRPTTVFALLKPIKYFIFAIILMYIGLLLNKTPYYLVSPIFSLLLIFKYLYDFLYIRTTVFNITKEQLEFKRGVFSIKTDFIELYRIKDHSLNQPFLLRLIGVNELIIVSSDETDPTFKIIGVKFSKDFIINLRKDIQYQRKLNRVYEVD